MELKEYAKIITKKWWLILGIVIIVVAITGIKNYLFTTPIYSANAKLIVNQSSSEGTNAAPSVGTVQTSIYLINSYKEIIKSAAIMNKVVEQFPDLGASAVKISSGISVTSANNSQVMNLTYQDQSYEKAANIVNAVSKVFQEQIPLIMKIDNITILTEADTTANPYPINLNPIMNIFISLIVSLILSIGLVLLLEYLDDTLKTESELMEILDIPVLAVVGKISKEDLKAARKKSLSQKQQVGDSQYATINQ